MKKVFLLSSVACLAMTANAQYSVNPSTSVVAEQSPKTVEYLVLSDGGVKELTDAGATCTYIGPDDVTRFMYIWDNTFAAGDGSYPAVDMEEGTYLSLLVGNIGWSGAGYFVESINTSMMNEETRFHAAYMSPNNNAPASVALIVGDGDNEGSSPAKVAIGSSFNDGGAIYPTIGPGLTDDWQGIDISFADLKKFYPSFNFVPADSWKGNILSLLAGGVEGQSVALDAVYFYNTGNSGINSAEADVDFVVTGKTVNVNNGRGIVLYNLAGQTVKTTEGCTLGLNSLAPGVYVARSGNKAVKVNVR